MVLGVFCGKHSAKGKAASGVGIVSDGDAVGIAVIFYGVNARNLIATDGVDAKLVSRCRCRTFRCSVGTEQCALCPRLLAVDISHYLLGKRYGSAARSVELVDVMHLFHLHIILWELVHYLCQISVHGREYCHANREIGCPKEGLAFLTAQTLYICTVVVHPTGRTAHHLNVVAEGTQIVALGNMRCRKLYGDIGRSKLSTV